MFLVAVGLYMCTMPATSCNHPANSQVQQRIREEWRKEELEHEKQVADPEIVNARWTWEDEQHAARLHKWDQERAQHEQEVKELIRYENAEHAARLHEWDQERAQHEQEVKERTQHENAEHAAQLHEWDQERAQHEQEVKERTRRENAEHAARLHEWERERVQHELELKERARREEEERKRMDLFWGRVEAHQCKTYGTREYTAVLMNLPVDCEWGMRACSATPLEIHGISRLPKRCEDKVRRVC